MIKVDGLSHHCESTTKIRTVFTSRINPNHWWAKAGSDVPLHIFYCPWCGAKLPETWPAEGESDD